MLLDDARQIAQQLIMEMAPHCQRVEIAGSIRRGKDEVKDIEIVAIPKWEMIPNPQDLFGGEVPGNLLYGWAIAAGHDIQWIKPGTSEIIPWVPKPEGKYWRGLINSEIKLDLFLTKEANFGAQFLIRTGSADFSHAVAAHAQRISRPFADGFLNVGGVPVETPDEARVFELLGLEYVEPAARVDGSAVRRVEVAA